MTTLDDMRKAICTERDNDELREIYAIMLIDDYGQPERGEFIRVGCELARIAIVSMNEAESGVSYMSANAGPHKYVRTDQFERYTELVRRERKLRFQIGPTLVPNSFRVVMSKGERQTNIPAVEFLRGFPCKVTCTAEDWLRHHETLYWHSEQTSPCRNHCERMSTRHDAPFMVYDHCGPESRWSVCEECSGTGRIPRPFVATAQPLEKVTLATPLDWHVGPREAVTLTAGPTEWTCRIAKDGCWYGKGGVVLDHITAAEWPGLEVELP